MTANSCRAWLPAYALVVCFGFASPATATVLTFASTADTPAVNIPMDYGNDVNALSATLSDNNIWTYLQGNGFTPNINSSYTVWQLPGGTTPTSGTQAIAEHLQWWNNTGDLPGGAVFSNIAVGTPEFDLLPQAGYRVVLNSFDVVSFGGATYTNQPVQVYDGNYNLLSSFGGPFTVNSTHLHFSPALTSTTGFRIEYGTNNNVGITNINFDQAVPEPGTLMLMACGAIGLFGICRLVAIAKPS